MKLLQKSVLLGMIAGLILVLSGCGSDSSDTVVEDKLTVQTVEIK